MPPKRGRSGGKAYFRQQQQGGSGSGSTAKPDMYKPRDQYPSTPAPKLVGLRRDEREQIEHFRRLRKRYQDGPLFTVLPPAAGGSGGVSSAAGAMAPAGAPRAGDLPGLRSGNSAAPGALLRDVDPFESLPTFSQKYRKPRRPVPQLVADDYVKAFFPLELHQFIDSSAVLAPQQLALSSRNARAKLTAAEEEELLENEGGMNADGEADEEDDMMVDEDDDFEEDEDEDDDYNAENYFSDGKSEAGGDDGGGDDY